MFDKIRRLIRPASKPAVTSPKAAPPLEQASSSNASKKVAIPFAPIPAKRFSSEMPIVAGSRHRNHSKPLLSVIVVIYDMPEQASKTLYSLSEKYQQGVSNADYEVIIVENNSSRPLGKERAELHGDNFSYYLREETEPTPVHAANFGVERAQGELVALMIDGARMVTPGILDYFISSLALSDHAVVATPGYHLGKKLQQQAMLEGYNESFEQDLLDSINWPENGYRLFDIACLSGTSTSGFFRPSGESNCLCVAKSLYQEVGGFDKRFNETGGGQANLDLYKRLVEHPDSMLIILPGEGSFHQFHGGVTTGQKGEVRHKAMVAHFAQYASIRGQAYTPPIKRPIYLGAISDNSLKFLRDSANKASIKHD